MSNEKSLNAARDAIRARLKASLDPRRSVPSSALISGGTARVETWKDGTPKNPILALEAELDEERFRADNEYRSRPDVLAKMSKLIKLRAERDAKTPPPPHEFLPTQAGYEKDREQIIADAKKAALDREIEHLEQRKSAMEVK